MRLNLDVDLCRKLLIVYTNHDLPSCTDQNRINQFANAEGWVACTRCWLLEVVDTQLIPVDVEFNLFSTVKLPKRETSVLLGEYADLLNNLGEEHPRTQNFLVINKDDREFLDLAHTANHLRRMIDRTKKS